MRTLFFLFVLLPLLIGCGRKNPETESAHGHDHEAESFQLTLYSEFAEFYVEYPAMTEAHKEELLIHITRLKDYKPFTEGRVKVVVDFGGKASSSMAESPIEPGIWRVLLRPEFSGECRLIFEYSGKDGTVHTVIGDAEVAEHSHTEDADVHADSQNRQEPEGDIFFTKEQAWKSDFTVREILPGSFSNIIKSGGEILAMPSEKYFIHARNSGIVNFSKRDLVAGDHVQLGEALMGIEGQDLVTRNIKVEFAEVKTNYLLSLSKYERHLKLLSENAITEREFLESRTEYVRDSIRLANLKKSFDGNGMNIKAPIRGHIHELNVSQGEFVEEGQLLATISSDKRLLLRADVPQQYFSIIRDIVSTHFRTSYHKKVWDIKNFNGRLLAVGSSVAENNQYLPVYFEAENNGELLEGAYAEFYLKTRTEENCITVPIPSILEEQGKYYVYVQKSGESFQKREVKPGESDGFVYRILDGILPGERVVTQGSMLLKAASMSTALPSHSHAH